MSDTTVDIELTEAELKELDRPYQEPARPMPQAAPFTAGRQERLRVMKAADAPPQNTGMDLLSQAIAGLLQMESELRQLAEDIVGPLELADDGDTPSKTDAPLIPRLRSDSERLCRLALRQHKLIQEVRQRL